MPLPLAAPGPALDSNLLGQPLIASKDKDNSDILSQSQPALPSAPSSSSSLAPPSSTPQDPPPPKPRTRVAFDLNATRRYSSAPYSLSTLSYTPAIPQDNHHSAKSNRHLSLNLDHTAPEANAYMPAGRPRGESDLSRPSQIRGKSQNGYGYGVSVAKEIGGMVGSGGQDRSMRSVQGTKCLRCV